MMNIDNYLQKNDLEQKGMLNIKQAPAVSLKRRKWGLGTPIQKERLFLLMNMSFLLVIITSIPYWYCQILSNINKTLQTNAKK